MPKLKLANIKNSSADFLSDIVSQKMGIIKKSKSDTVQLLNKIETNINNIRAIKPAILAFSRVN